MASFTKVGALALLLGAFASPAQAAFEIPIDFTLLSEPVAPGVATAAAVRVIGDSAGGVVHFPDAANARDFRILSASDPALSGLKGTISPPSGGFGISGVAGSHGVVTGTGSFTVFDADDAPLTADLQFLSILGVSGIYQLNPDTLVNLSNWTYTGSNPALRQIRDSGTGTLTLNWRMSGTTLALITSSGDRSATYGGSFQTTYFIPEPALLALSVLALPLTLRRNRRPARQAPTA